MQRKLTLLFILSNGANEPVLWGLAREASNWGKSYLLWARVVGRHAVLSAAHVHPDLGSDQNTLNQLGLSEGHFPRLLSYTWGKCLVSKDGETEPKTRTTQCSNNGDVFTTHINKNTRSMSATSTSARKFARKSARKKTLSTCLTHGLALLALMKSSTWPLIPCYISCTTSDPCVLTPPPKQ